MGWAARAEGLPRATGKSAHEIYVQGEEWHVRVRFTAIGGGLLGAG